MYVNYVHVDQSSCCTVWPCISCLNSMASWDLGVLMHHKQGWPFCLSIDLDVSTRDNCLLCWHSGLYMKPVGVLLDGIYLHLCRMVLRLGLNNCYVKYLPSLVMNHGPGCVPCIERYGTIAFMGHILVPILPSNISIPWQKWSILDCFT